ncbi:MAG TPA: 2Fe-2S iron-sulfur cluster-binding protein [Thermoplasmata archaeon]|nr:2Fe-2S iron-sulfur cluster-binding protein [Thermoplasmata archaeon]
MDPERAPRPGAGRTGPDLRTLGTRSTRYHRPRAPFCGVGYCTNCLVRVNGVPNVRACQTEFAPGDTVTVENAWPSARFDLLATFDVLFPSGIDTLRGFRRPAFARTLYQRVVRRLAGTGAFPTPTHPVGIPPAKRLETDVVIIGGGTAGRACAAAFVAAGGSSVVVEREPHGSPVTGAETLLGTTAVFLPPPDPGRPHPFRLIASATGGSAVDVQARRVVVAVGGYDASLWFAGSDRPGVLTADGAERMRPAEAPGFRRAVVFGGGPRALEMLNRFSDHAEALVAPGAIDPDVSRRGSELDIPLYPRTLLLGALGRRQVTKLRLARRGGHSPTFDVAADAVILAHRRLPHAQLFFQAGARMTWQPVVGAYTPALGPGGQTTVPGLFAVGEPAGARSADDARTSGTTAAAALLAGGSWPSLAPTAGDPSHHELEGYYQELLTAGPGPGKVVACPCEDVLLSELLEATDRGYRGIEVAKRYTGLGTGMCQGRYCLPEALLVLALRERRPVSEVGYITQRPPVVPTPLGALAGLPDPGGPVA